MRTLALALAAALPVWLAAPAAQAVCTTGVDCIRERFGANPMPRNNSIINRTDRLGDRNRPVNPYVARQGLRVAPGNRTIYDPTGQQGATLERLQPNQLRPDAGYAPGSTANPYAPGGSAPAPGSALGPARVLSPGGGTGVQPYEPAAAATGPATGLTAGQPEATSPYASRSRTAQPVRRDPNTPAGAADLQSPGVNR